MLKSLVHQRTMAISTALFLVMSSGAMAQTPAGTTTIADIEQAGYTNVTEVEPNYDESAAAFQATSPDGGTVTIEIQQGTGEWLVVRHEPRSVVTRYRAGEAPPDAMPTGETAPGGAMQMEPDGEMVRPTQDPGMTDSPMEMDPAMETEPGMEMDPAMETEPGMEMDPAMTTPTPAQ